MTSPGSAPTPAILRDGFMEQLWPFQREGVRFGVAKQGKCLVGDEMGLGKTVQAIGIAAHYYPHDFPVLVVVPASVKLTWADEFERWTKIPRDEIRVVKKRDDLKAFHDSKVVIMTYGMFVKKSPVAEHVAKKGFKCVILDECHAIKNKDSQRYQILHPTLATARRVIMLSGTPALGRPIELWTQINALQPNIFGSYWSYARKFCEAHQTQMGWWDVKGASNTAELHRLLNQYVLIRRLKSQVLTELPPKIHQRITVEVAPAKLRGLQKTMTDVESMVKKLTALEQAGKAREAGNLSWEFKKTVMAAYRACGEAKVEGVKTYLKELMIEEGGVLAPRERILLFALHKPVMDAIAEFLREKGIEYVRIDGSTPAQTRYNHVQRFQDTSNNVRVALLSMLAAGTGVSLTAARMVVFAELHWTPGVLTQAEDRAHRIGQQHSVHVVYLIPEGETPDKLVWNVMSKKMRILGEVLDGDGGVVLQDRIQHAMHGSVDPEGKLDAEYVAQVTKPESPSNAQSYAQEQFPATPTKIKSESSSQPQAHVKPEQGGAAYGGGYPYTPDPPAASAAAPAESTAPTKKGRSLPPAITSGTSAEADGITDITYQPRALFTTPSRPASGGGGGAGSAQSGGIVKPEYGDQKATPPTAAPGERRRRIVMEDEEGDDDGAQAPVKAEAAGATQSFMFKRLKRE